MEPEQTRQPDELLSLQSFRELDQRFEHLQNRQADKASVFRVAGQVITKRVMSKVLGFVEISQNTAESAEHNGDPYLCQLLLEDNSEDRVTGGSEIFRNLHSFVDREVHLGDIVEATGFPEKTQRGRVSLHLVTINILKKWKEMSPNLTFNPNKERQAYRERLRTIAEEKGVTTADSAVLEASAAAFLSKIPLCKWTIRQEKCQRANCPLRHTPDPHEEYRIKRLVAQRAAVLEKEHDPNDPFEDKKSKRLRAGIFAKWLVAKFGASRLNSGAGVLDVAGGLGRLSFELFIENGIKTTLVEPRRLKLTKKQRRILKEKQMEMFSQIQDYFDEALWCNEDCPKVVKDCSVVIGLHPDQATEPIVDFAIANNKPFAIIPCCVFANLWPERRVDGKPVVTYSEFIEYLLRKHPKIQVDFLEMAGRNKILYYDPMNN